MANEVNGMFDVFNGYNSTSSDDGECYDSDRDFKYDFSDENDDSKDFEANKAPSTCDENLIVGGFRKSAGQNYSLSKKRHLDVDYATASNVRINKNLIQTQDSDAESCDSDDDQQVPINDDDWEVSFSDGLPFDLSDWTESLENFPQNIQFDGTPCINIPMDDYSALSCFQLFFDDFLYKHLTEETNRYATQLKEMLQGNTPQLNEKSKIKDTFSIRNWTTLTLKETKGFILILIHMSVVKKHSINDYWSADEFVQTPFAARIMSRDRFRAILSMVHFSNNDNYIPVNQPNHDPLFKVRTIYEHLQQRFQEVYTPDQNVVIGEAVCPWRGRLPFKLFLKEKPGSWGIKFYQLCESSSGYVYRFEIYAAEPNLSDHPSDVLLRLMSPLLTKGYHIFCDDYYTNPELFHMLTQQNTMCTGSVRASRRGMPKDLAVEKLKSGDIAFRRRHNLVAIHWKDKQDVRILTSAYDPTESVIKTTPNTTNKITPKAFAQYAQFMSGVDYNDQLIASVPLARRTQKWPTKIFMHLLTLCIIQSKIIFDKLQKQNNKHHPTLPQYMKMLGKELTHDFMCQTAPRSVEKVKVVKKPQDLLRLDRDKFHYLEPLPSTAAKRKPRRNCKVCYDVCVSVPGKRKRSKETYLRCAVCGIPLCVDPCFMLFHTQMNYVAAARKH